MLYKVKQFYLESGLLHFRDDFASEKELRTQETLRLYKKQGKWHNVI